ncbi:hypothetical protein [Acetobacter thailandicus]|uniref:Uncharacterized protein n=1 Tax=Acetobacter thailandicus TaxID=1502842 RepID=A0ABT3QBL7_9PROT|nr:hypothetical protein [Acetobacter thailandicus]MCX2562687.1 hypothetical protein [Acetobacter thailandicus]NHN94752.1 hypothetical protein [Acetobacter thailandicus]
MDYHIQEASFDLPAGFVDQSINVLTLSPEQTTQLENVRYEQNTRRFITYLRESEPDKTVAMTDMEMHTLV